MTAVYGNIPHIDVALRRTAISHVRNGVGPLNCLRPLLQEPFVLGAHRLRVDELQAGLHA